MDKATALAAAKEKEKEKEKQKKEREKQLARETSQLRSLTLKDITIKGNQFVWCIATLRFEHFLSLEVRTGGKGISV